MNSINTFTLTLYCCPMLGCSKEYKNKFNLKRHLTLAHFFSKPFSCNLCHKRFATKQNASEHNYIHSGIKPYKCLICGRHFRQASLLCLHKRKHNPSYIRTLSYAENLD